MRFAVLALASMAVAISSVASVSVEQCSKEFSHWMVKYGKAYDNSEMFSRFKTFCKTIDDNEAFNAKKFSSTKGLNQFSAHTEAEWKSMMGFKRSLSTARKVGNDARLASVKAPASVDWTQQGAVTAIKNQGQCGSCWSFSTTGSTEGAWFLAGNPLVSLSEQQIMDCSTAFGNQGCNGGVMDNAFQWIINNSGVTSEANDPYVSGSGTDPNSGCTSYPSVAKITTYTDVAQNEAAVIAAVAIGPVSIAIEADQSCFQGYTGGVLSYASCACGSNLDHGVLIVGYGTDSASGLDFWKVKNSWGTSWGEAGYIRLQRGPGVSQPTGGMCGILTQASYPVVN